MKNVHSLAEILPVCVSILCYSTIPEHSLWRRLSAVELWSKLYMMRAHVVCHCINGQEFEGHLGHVVSAILHC